EHIDWRTSTVGAPRSDSTQDLIEGRPPCAFQLDEGWRANQQASAGHRRVAHPASAGSLKSKGCSDCAQGALVSHPGTGEERPFLYKGTGLMWRWRDFLAQSVGGFAAVIAITFALLVITLMLDRRASEERGHLLGLLSKTELLVGRLQS